MKRSDQFNTKPTIESIPNSGSTIPCNISYGVNSDTADDFDPALELKRLRQELIERLLIIQRKAALNAQSEKQKQLAVTIIPKPIQSSPITHPKITIANGITNEISEKNLNKFTDTDITQRDRDNVHLDAGSMSDLLYDPENAAKRIMANIESARICINNLQVPNISQPSLKHAKDRLPNQQNYNEKTNQKTDNLKLQPQINPASNEQLLQQYTLNKTDNEIKSNVNSEILTSQNPTIQTLQQSQSPKSDWINESWWVILLQKLNIGLSLVGVVGILFGLFYLLNGNICNFQPGVPVLFVGLVLIISGLTGHLLQEYVNNNYPINHS
ncbi:MAG: DUF2892 domain-containing protein [Planctomycetaceae bacterium]|jgi:hypothetical protein|nr:DUF2892 domain-containing protein [Planctomycetaceae bacterium]